MIEMYSKMPSQCVETVHTREESESRVRK